MEPNQAYYFLSTNAQVWAALIAFGGMAIRDRIKDAEKTLEEIETNLAQLAKECVNFYKRFGENGTPEHFLIRRDSMKDFFRNPENRSAKLLAREAKEHKMKTLRLDELIAKQTCAHPINGMHISKEYLVREAEERFQEYSAYENKIKRVYRRQMKILVIGGSLLIAVSMVLLLSVESSVSQYWFKALCMLLLAGNIAELTILATAFVSNH